MEWRCLLSDISYFRQMSYVIDYYYAFITLEGLIFWRTLRCDRFRLFYLSSIFSFKVLLIRTPKCQLCRTTFSALYITNIHFFGDHLLSRRRSTLATGKLIDQSVNSLMVTWLKLRHSGTDLSRGKDRITPFWLSS